VADRLLNKLFSKLFLFLLQRKSNCILQAYLLQKKIGGELVFIPTKREYKWPWHFPHAFVRTRTGLEIEYVPEAKTLGDYPKPFFIGHLKVRHTASCPCSECKKEKS